MEITRIEEITGSRSKVYIDEEFAFVLYKGELRHYKLTVGEEVTEETYHDIVNVLLVKRAKRRSMALLKSRPYTEKQMYDKLKQVFYPESAISQAILYLESYGYLDDARYAQDYIDYHKETKSRRRLEQDLLGKGIAKSVIAEAFREWEEQGNEIEEADQIARWIRKKSYDIRTNDPKEKQKMAAFLFRKGFAVSNIQKALQYDGSQEMFP